MIAPNVKKLRTSMTDAERKLWWVLRARGAGSKFRRQVPLGPYVVDFVRFESKLIVEVDGSQHADNRRDVVRDRYFTDQGYRVLRFWNTDVLKNLQGVIACIAELVDPSPGSPSSLRSDRSPPSPSRGEGKNPAARQ
jgi:very-short-patch-repair endonuclease